MKKTLDNPPASLKKAILNASESKDWDHARREWSMDAYYHDESQRQRCPCSVTEIKNIVVIVNLKTGQRLEICGGCAKTLFLMVDPDVLETNRRGLQKSPHHLLDDVSLQYMCHKIAISRLLRAVYALYVDYKEHIVLGDWGFHKELKKTIAKINNIFLELTDYSNKQYFDMLDDLFVHAAQANWNDMIDKELARLHSLLQGVLYIEEDKVEYDFGQIAREIKTRYKDSGLNQRYDCRTINLVKKSIPLFSKYDYRLFACFQFQEMDFSVFDYSHYLSSGDDYDILEHCTKIDRDFIDSYVAYRCALLPLYPNDGIRLGPHAGVYWIGQLLKPHLADCLESTGECIKDRENACRYSFDWSKTVVNRPVPKEFHPYTDETLNAIWDLPYDDDVFDDEWHNDFSELIDNW